MSALHGINANLLVALDGLLVERSVTRAAAKAGITQSAMSNALAQMRGLLQDPLLVRVGRGMEPTPVALALAPELRAAVEGFSRVLARGRGFDPATSADRFTMALSDRVEAVLFADLLARVRSVAPGVSLQVLPWGRLETPPGLATDIDLNVGIVMAPSLSDWPSGPPRIKPGLHQVSLLDAGLATIVRKGHPRVRRRLTLKTFCELDHILVTEQPQGTGIIDDALARLGKQRTVAARVPRHTLVGDLIARTDLIASVDRRIANRFASSHNLHVLNVPVALPPGRLGMVWHERTHADPARRWLRAQLEDVAAALD